jgi:hypothetical protein
VAFLRGCIDALEVADEVTKPLRFLTAPGAFRILILHTICRFNELAPLAPGSSNQGWVPRRSLLLFIGANRGRCSEISHPRLVPQGRLCLEVYCSLTGARPAAIVSF